MSTLSARRGPVKLTPQPEPRPAPRVRPPASVRDDLPWIEVPPVRRSSARPLHVWFTVPATLAVLAGFAFGVDFAVARFGRSPDFPQVVREVLNNVEPFGHAVGVAVVGLAVFALDRQRRRYLPRILWGAIGAGLAADIIKACVSRCRPRDLEALAGGVFDTFRHGSPLYNGLSMNHSFPSAHTAVATAFAVMLAHYYPKGRALFAALAVLVAAHRVVSNAHFLSDVCVGALVGWLFANACLRAPRSLSLFDRIEERAVRHEAGF